MGILINFLSNFALYISIPIFIRYAVLRKPLKNKWIAISIIIALFIFFSIILIIAKEQYQMKLYQELNLPYKSRPHMFGSPLLYVALFFSYHILHKGYKNMKPLMIYALTSIIVILGLTNLFYKQEQLSFYIMSPLKYFAKQTPKQKDRQTSSSNGIPKKPPISTNYKDQREYNQPVQSYKYKEANVDKYVGEEILPTKAKEEEGVAQITKNNIASTIKTYPKTALGDLNGLYVHLDINDSSQQGVTRQRINKNKLLKYVEKQLIDTIGRERGIRLFKPIYPHLNVKVIIEGQEHHTSDRLKKYMYYVTVEANINRNASEWHKKHTESWEKNTKVINSAKKRVNDAAARLNKDKTQSSKKRNRLYLKNAKRDLSNTIKRYAIARTAESLLRRIVGELTRDYRSASRLENEHKRKEKETKELLDRLAYEKRKAISLQQKNKGVVQNTNRNIISSKKIGSSTLTTYQVGDHIHNVLKDHPDYINITECQKFKDYVNNLSSQQLETAMRIKESGTEEEIIQLISNYKSQEDYQEAHRLMIKDVIDNYDVFDESRAMNILQDWINKEEDNAKVIKLSVDDNSSNRFNQTYLITYTIAKGSDQNKYMYEYNLNTKATRKMVYLNDED